MRNNLYIYIIASGSLDSLMADLMDSMNEAIDQCAPTRTSPPPADGCSICHKPFNRNDDSLMYEKKVIIIIR